MPAALPAVQPPRRSPPPLPTRFQPASTDRACRLLFGVRRKSYPNIASALTLHGVSFQPVLARVLVQREQTRIFSAMRIRTAIVGIGVSGAARLFFVVRLARVLFSLLGVAGHVVLLRSVGAMSVPSDESCTWH